MKYKQICQLIVVTFHSTIRELEGNLTKFVDEVYEHHARKFPGGDWEPDNPRYVDSVRKNGTPISCLWAITALF